MQVTAAQRHKLKKFIKSLENFRGRHTELVSVYVPAGYDLVKIMQHLAEEQGTATNIKSSATRKNVIDALERMIQHLKIILKNPENGLAVFSGNVAEREGQSDVQVWSIEPPLPMNQRLYRCDKAFVLDPLRDMCTDKEGYGLIVMDRRDANIAFLRGKTIVPLVKTHSEVPGKFRAGGQSAQRFERLRDGAAKQHYKKVAEYVKEQFLNNPDIKGIIVGGPGPTKYDFVEGNYITDQVKKKIIAIKDLSYTGDFGLQELLDRSEDVLAQEDVTTEKKIMARFFDILAKDSGKVSYGEDEVMKHVKNGVVEVVLVSEAAGDDKIELFEEEAEKFNTEVKIISTETREGAQLEQMGKYAAILRYSIS
ncbi:peptide chain release factor 1 [Candidatus Woesearchaeota archaeon]|jgi:peptide chain release factor subunit 1|nr:peptide chain release factor 1 [Candidatus Woesearchaeota archaeon]MBT5272226.1 peptide chain release factor 1 [Candidatus Woesearchaeota archaeon]MBT6040522.1 peptide chain release factor 1 [Candidatus Woesearchaeota archaeon]MBT6336498.1 peptide chain release factor 1 [Candidatus Woesearchaeota archaeon]MBT7927388.1 peptide chain release factor 1 [Candidatus Woesearchaeota archaeon]